MFGLFRCGPGRAPCLIGLGPRWSVDRNSHHSESKCTASYNSGRLCALFCSPTKLPRSSGYVVFTFQVAMMSVLRVRIIIRTSPGVGLRDLFSRLFILPIFDFHLYVVFSGWGRGTQSWEPDVPETGDDQDRSGPIMEMVNKNQECQQCRPV